MIFKNPVCCGNCQTYLGFRLGSEPVGSIYCRACEPFVTHQEEMREADIARYRAMARLGQQS